MSGGWGCPHDENGICAKRDAPCDPGEPRCVLEERMKPKGNPVDHPADEAQAEEDEP